MLVKALSNRRRPGARRAGLAALAVTSVAALGVSAIGGQIAYSDINPPSGVPATVSADALPTWQVNGVVWHQVLVGNTVYVTGKFTKARPPGKKVGDPSEVTRNNLLAYDIRTGNLITSFNHSLNAQGLVIEKSPDGKRVYVGGDFTTVDGLTRKHVAAFDVATGKLISTFAPNVSNKVRAIAATNSTVWFGGNFFNVNGYSRSRLAAVAASNGANVQTFKPTTDDEVFALALSPDAKRLIVGGRFQKLNDAQQVGVGALDPVNGASLTWTSKPTPTRIGGAYSYVTDLAVQGDVIYGSNDGEGGHWFDGRWAAKVADGELVWLDNCYGATYGIQPVGNVVYSVSHAHDCSSLGAFPELSGKVTPRWRRALAETAYPTGTDKAPPGSNSNYSGQPVPSLLHWFPELSPGTYTGQAQAAWSIVGNGSYISLGGEFPRVNGFAQQGLTRYAVKSLATIKRGPVTEKFTTTAPTVRALFGRKVTVTWKTTWDQDNNILKYEVFRDGGTTPVSTQNLAATFWDMPTATFTDSGLTARAKHTYKVKVTDLSSGKSLTSPVSSTVTVLP